MFGLVPSDQPWKMYSPSHVFFCLVKNRTLQEKNGGTQYYVAVNNTSS